MTGTSLDNDGVREGHRIRHNALLILNSRCFGGDTIRLRETGGWLSARHGGIVVADGDVTIPLPFVLTGGDANGDDAVSFADVAILQNSHGRSVTPGTGVTSMAMGR